MTVEKKKYWLKWYLIVIVFLIVQIVLYDYLTQFFAK